MRRKAIKLTCRDCGEIAVAPAAVTLHVSIQMITLDCPRCGRVITKPVSPLQEDALFDVGVQIVV